MSAPAHVLSCVAPVEPRSRSLYSELLHEVRRTQLLDRSLTRFLPEIFVLAALIGLGLAVMVELGSSWWQVGMAVFFAGISAQLGFLGHDAGHQQVCRTRRANDWLGLVVSNLGMGLSYGWWVRKHTSHHNGPNDLDHDPDVQRNVMAWTPGQAQEQRGVLRVIARHQDLMFLPLIALEALNLHIGSVRSLLTTPSRRRCVEGVLPVAHASVFVSVPFVLMSPWQALVFLVVHQMTLGVYLGLSFALNHKGMPIYDGDAPSDFVHRQVLTSRNIRGGRLLDIALGNLNYQIEHHLFPSMPSHELRHCRPLVKDFCRRHEIPYCETGLTESYRRSFRALAEVCPPS